jgi:hypothetical protein
MKVVIESTKTGDIKITTPRWTSTIPAPSIDGPGKCATGGYEFTWRRFLEPRLAEPIKTAVENLNEGQRIEGRRSLLSWERGANRRLHRQGRRRPVRLPIPPTGDRRTTSAGNAAEPGV